MYPYRYRRFSSSDDSQKKSQYIKLRNKMQSILSKSRSLDNKIGTLKSSIKQCLVVDNLIHDENSYNVIDNNVNELIEDINNVISSINSHI